VSPALHPDLEPLTFLLGTWAGTGDGAYPTIADFAYGEQITMAHTGAPFLSYMQRTWSLADNRPLHAETGYLRTSRTGTGWRVQLVVAQPTGIVEVDEGVLARALKDGRSCESIVLGSTTVARTSTAKDVTAVRRAWEVCGDVMSERLEMAAVGQPLQLHLEARLTRQDHDNDR
jgi:hypothetical protein